MSSPTPTQKPVLAATFDQYPLARVMFLAYGQRLTGFISAFDAKGENALVYFREGTPVAAILPHYADDLGRLLVEIQSISFEAYEESLRRMAETGARHEETLVEMGAITTDQLTAALKLQLRRKLIHLFSWQQARFEVYAREHEYGRGQELARLRVHPRRLIYYGIRNAYDDARLLREAPTLESRSYRIKADARASLVRYGFEADDLKVIDALCAGAWTFAKLRAATGCDPTVVRMILYALGVTDVLELASETTPANLDAGAAPIDTDAAGPPAVPPTTAAVICDGAAIPAASGPVAPPAAGRPESAPPAAVEAAPGSPSHRPVTSLPATAADTATPVAAPESRPSAARPRLDPASRKPTPVPTNVTPAKNASTANLPLPTRKEILAKESVIGQQNLFEVLGLTEAATKDDIRQAYLQLARMYHPDRLRRTDYQELQPQMERIFARISEANSTLMDDAQRSSYVLSLSDPPSNSGSTRAQQALDAEMAVQRGSVALKRREFTRAVVEFKHAVDLNPDEGEHHALLAWAIYQESPHKPTVVGEVKQLLSRAITLSPRCAPAHFFLGEVLMAEGALEPALAAYRRVLAIDEFNVDAQRACRLITTRLEKEPKKGGLFDRFRKK